MMKKLFIALSAVVLVCATSCSGLRTFQQVQGVSITPDFVRLDINFDNMQPLGETTISIETRTYLGFITVLDKVNGVEYDRRNQRTAMLKGDGLNIRLAGNLRKALVKVLDEYPGADYYVVTSAKVETNQMFLGKEQTKTMVVKAYKYMHK
ncbi:MAG: hypothetical protein J6Y34_07760 [Bacteroidales bacterium]|nr:hypothetical protein [Bacteroidales bacterium]